MPSPKAVLPFHNFAFISMSNNSPCEMAAHIVSTRSFMRRIGAKMAENIDRDCDSRSDESIEKQLTVIDEAIDNARCMEQDTILWEKGNLRDAFMEMLKLHILI